MKLEEIEASLSECEHLSDTLEEEIRAADEKMQEIQRQMDVWENELDILAQRKEDFPDEAQDADDRMQEIEQQLDRWQQEHDALSQEKDELISEKKINRAKLGDLRYQRDGAFIRKSVSDAAVSGAKKAAAAPFAMAANTVKSGVRSVISKANPFDKKINKNDAADTGMESMRLAYRSIKTTKNTVKTTVRSVKTVQRTAQNSVRAVRFTYRAAAYTVRAAARIARAAGTAVTHIAAFFLNPFVLLVVFLLLAAVLLLSVLLSAFTQNYVTTVAYSDAVGLGDAAAQYSLGSGYFQIAVENKKNSFYSLIDGMYYDYNDLTHSDLVYMERYMADGTQSKWLTSFSTDTRKNTLKNAWSFSVLTENEANAIAYVYLEKQQNNAHGTEYGIYEVEYTQEVFDLIVEKCVTFNDTVYHNQSCGMGCTAHTETYDNPAYAEASAAYTAAYEAREAIVAAHNEWVEIVNLLIYRSSLSTVSEKMEYYVYTILPLIQAWNDTWSAAYGSAYTSNDGYDFLAELYAIYEEKDAAYNAALETLNNTPATYEAVTYSCDLEHDLHSIGLWYYDKETVMDALGFTDYEKEWESLTESGFAANGYA